MTELSHHRAREIARTLDWRSLPREFLDNPYPVYRALLDTQPIKRMFDGSLLLTRHADLVTVYRDAQAFSSAKHVEFGPKYGVASPLFAHHTTSLVFNDPPLHTRVRRLIMGALTRRAIAELEPALTTLVDGLIADMLKRGGGDLIEDFASAIPVDVIGNLLAIPHSERAPLRAWSLAILGALEPIPTEQQLARGNAAVTQFGDYLGELARQRRKTPGDPDVDVLTRLIQAPDLSVAELLHNCIFILNAGHETTTNLIGNALVTLCDPVESTQNARRQLLLFSQQQTQWIPRPDAKKPSNSPTQDHLSEFWDCAVDEFLRFESSNQLGNRRAVHDFTLAGEQFSAGTLLTLCIGSANRDPAVFDEPDTLRIDRNPNPHLAFGFGLHQCAGMSLARLEGRVAISRFLAAMPNYALTQAPTRGARARFRGFLKAPFTCG